MNPVLKELERGMLARGDGRKNDILLADLSEDDEARGEREGMGEVKDRMRSRTRRRTKSKTGLGEEEEEEEAEGGGRRGGRGGGGEGGGGGGRRRRKRRKRRRRRRRRRKEEEEEKREKERERSRGSRRRRRFHHGPLLFLRCHCLPRASYCVDRVGPRTPTGPCDTGSEGRVLYPALFVTGGEIEGSNTDGIFLGLNLKEH
eukprot:189287-Hanusia_phi.AAC.1